MAFRLVKTITPAGNGQIGNHWISIPYVNPYGGTAAGFCAKTGLLSSGIYRAGITVLDETTGTFQSANCGTAGAANISLRPGKFIQVRQPNGPGARSKIVIVGSHDPNILITIPAAGAGQIGNYWFSVPYNTTAVTANDLCLQAGLSSSGISRAGITRLDPVTGTFTSGNCGTSATQTMMLVPGEGIQIREPNGPKSFYPAHY